MTNNFFDSYIDDAATDNEILTADITDQDDANEPTAIDHEPNEPSEGVLPDEVRKALVFLLKRGVVLGAKKPDIFATICQHQTAIRQHLDNMYLRLVIDDRAGILFVAAMEDDEEVEDGLSLISKRTLSVYDTLILLILRKHFQEREAVGEQRIIIDVDSINAQLVPFLPLTNSSTAERKKLTVSLNKMAEKQVLTPVKESDDRYEITPIIRHIASAEILERMLADYIRLAQEAAGTDDSIVERVDTLKEPETDEQKHSHDNQGED